MKTVVFSNGDGHDYVIYAVLQVPDEMVQEKMWDIFVKEHYPNATWDQRIFREEYKVDQQYIKRQGEILKEKGYEGYNETTYFIDWLCKHHGCVNIPFEEW